MQLDDQKHHYVERSAGHWSRRITSVIGVVREIMVDVTSRLVLYKRTENEVTPFLTWNIPRRLIAYRHYMLCLCNTLVAERST